MEIYIMKNADAINQNLVSRISEGLATTKPEEIGMIDEKRTNNLIEKHLKGETPFISSDVLNDAAELNPENHVANKIKTRIESVESATETFIATRKEMIKSIDMMSKSMDDVSTKTKTAASRGKDAANQLTEAVHRITKLAGSDLENHVKNLERLNTALETLAAFEKSGLLERIGKAISPHK